MIGKLLSKLPAPMEFPGDFPRHDWKVCTPAPTIKVKRLHPDAIIPKYQTAGAACFDLHSLEMACILPGGAYTVRTGLAFEVPEGYVMLCFSRSGHGFNSDVRLANCVGVIDSDYRGELRVRLTHDKQPTLQWPWGLTENPVIFSVKSGDRVAQAMIIPVQQWHLQEVDELSTTERGEKGYGSTGA